MWKTRVLGLTDVMRVPVHVRASWDSARYTVYKVSDTAVVGVSHQDAAPHEVYVAMDAPPEIAHELTASRPCLGTGREVVDTTGRVIAMDLSTHDAFPVTIPMTTYDVRDVCRGQLVPLRTKFRTLHFDSCGTV